MATDMNDIHFRQTVDEGVAAGLFVWIDRLKGVFELTEHGRAYVDALPRREGAQCVSEAESGKPEE